MPGLAGDDLGHRDAFVLGLVRQHRPPHRVADGVDALHSCREVIIDLDPAAVVQLDAGFLEPEILV